MAHHSGHVLDIELRQVIYRMLGLAFLYPTSERLATLTKAARQFSPVDLPRQNGNTMPLDLLLEALDGLDESHEEAIEEEYVRLFVANPAAPPYESYYLDPEGLARGWIFVALERSYAESGLVLAPSFKQPPDHLAVELEFMAYLCSLEAQALKDGQPEEVSRVTRLRQAFWKRHLGRWFPRFAQRVRQAMPSQHYGALVNASEAHLRWEAQAS